MQTISTTSGQQVRLRRKRVPSQISLAARLHLLSLDPWSSCSFLEDINCSSELLLSFLFCGALVHSLHQVPCCPANATNCHVRDVASIANVGLSSSPQQGGSLTAPSIGAGMLLGQEGGQQTQPISHSQQLQLLAANGIGNMSGIYNNSLGSDSFGDSSQYANGGLHGAGGLLPSNLSGLTALGNGYGGKLQQGLPNNGPPLNGFGAQQQGQDFSSLQLNGGVGGILNNGLTNAALAAKLAGLPNLGRGGGYANGLGNGSLAGMCAGSALPGANGHLSAIHGSGLPGGYTLQQQQQHHHHQQQQHLQQQQQQQQMLQEQLQALGPAGIAQLPPQLQAYARELLLRQQRAALMGAQLQQQPPPLPFGTPGVQGPAAAQRLDLAGFRRDIYRNELPLGRQGSRPLPPKVTPAAPVCIFLGYA